MLALADRKPKHLRLHACEITWPRHKHTVHRSVQVEYEGLAGPFMKSPQTQIYIKESRKTCVLEICFIYIYNSSIHVHTHTHTHTHIYIYMDEWAGRQADRCMEGQMGG